MASFECSVCGEEQQGPVFKEFKDKSPACEECITTYIPPLFQCAFENKKPKDYPPRWGPEKLQVEDFRNVLGDEFVARYINILPELKATGSNKLYCKHSMLKEDRDPQQRGSSPPEGVVLALSEQAIDAATTADDKSTVPCGAFIEKDDKKPPVQTCYHCNGRVCTLCGLPLRSSDKHDCVTPEEVTHEYIEKGCNSLQCVNCETEFCFLCGVEALHDDDHWRVGNKCPRFHGATAANAQHDPPSDINIVDLVVLRGTTHLANGGRMDAEWANNMFAEVHRLRTTIAIAVPEGFLQVVNGNAANTPADDIAGNPTVLGDDGHPILGVLDWWRYLLTVHRGMHDGDRLTFVTYETIRFQSEWGDAFGDHEYLNFLLQMAEEIIRLLPENARLNALDQPVLGEERATIVSDYLVVISHFMNLGPIPALFPQRLRALIQEFMDTAPLWAWNEGRDKVLDRPTDRDVVDMIVQRGDAHRANGGQIDNDWIDGIEAEMDLLHVTIGIITLRPEASNDEDDDDDAREINPAEWWHQIQVVHHGMQNNDRLTFVRYEINRMTEEGQGYFTDPNMVRWFACFAADMLNLLPENARLSALTDESVGDELNHAVESYLHVLGHVTDRMEQGIQLTPLMEVLWLEFRTGLPEWIKREAIPRLVHIREQNQE